MPTTYGTNLTNTNIAGQIDPQGTGTSWEYSYTGTATAINALAATLLSQGVRYRITNDNGIYTLVASYAVTPGETETPNDAWGFDTEGTNISVFAHPYAFTEATAKGYTLAEYKKLIVDAVNEGTNSADTTFASWDFAVRIYKLLSMNQEYYEVRRPVLKRQRKFSADYTQKMTIDPYQRVWTTQSLITEFAIPSDVQNRIPNDALIPASETPQGCAWGWRLSIDTSEYNPSLRKWSESKQWSFAAWPVDFYLVA